MKKFVQFISYVGLFVLALAILVSGVGAYTVTRSFPQTSGTLRVPGLQGRVDIYRDSNGIPHIYADNIHDLFFAQGYAHTQDRFYQMDFWRHQTAGRLSELYGEASLGQDRFLRTVGWMRVAEQEYSLLDPESRAILDAYAEGVNAYIGSRRVADLSLEYSILALNGLKYRPEPWSPVSVLAWAKAMAWDLRGNLDDEIKRAVLNVKIGEQKTSEYMPAAYPSDHPVILPSLAVGGRALENLHGQLNQLDAFFGEHSKDLGSNNWVVAGSRTTTGKPLLANDPHLAIQMPAIWYEVGLHCTNPNPECSYNVTGVSFAGGPGVIIGHNDRIAWGMTNVGPDVQDLYIERVNPSNSNQYEVNGQWADMTVINETVTIKGKIKPDPEDPEKDLGAYHPETNTTTVNLTIRYTRHGPIITDVYDLKDFADDSGLDPNYKYAFALRWTALEAGFTWRSILRLDRARSFDEFRDALRDFVAPSQNLVYADVDGNIGYQVPGRIPIRAKGDGLLPVPGWTDEYEWTGYIPFDELPYSYNPPQGYIATANNAIVGPDYPYLISLEWDAGYRARRIVDLLNAQPKMDIAYLQKMQGDNMSLGAKEILPYLLALRFDDPKLAKAQEALRAWNYQLSLDSHPAAIYMSFFNALVADTFHDDIPEDYWPDGSAGTWLVLRGLLEYPGSDWWDNQSAPGQETRDDILRQAFAESYAALEKRLGSDSAEWTWGGLHTATFVNATVGQTGIAPIDALFNRGPFSTAGFSGVVNNTGGSLARDDRTDPARRSDAFAARSVPSLRLIADMSDLRNSLLIHTTGQSGHAFHSHYVDMADRWRNIQYHPMLWSFDSVVANAEAHLALVP